MWRCWHSRRSCFDGLNLCLAQRGLCSHLSKLWKRVPARFDTARIGVRCRWIGLYSDRISIFAAELEWALPFFSVAAFLSVVVPSMFYRDLCVDDGRIDGHRWLLCSDGSSNAAELAGAAAFFAAVNAALLSGTLIWVSDY